MNDTARTGELRLPGDPAPSEQVARMIRVDQAGEYGAVRIYAGQIAVLGRDRSAPVIREMAEQEHRHLERFSQLVAQRGVRPTALEPLWHVAGFALGAAGALLGREAAMACTEAVETVIDEHYAAQAARLGDDEGDLRSLIEESRADEIHHRDVARAHDAARAPAHGLLGTAVRAGTRAAIWLSERV